ncbi:MAG: tRNA (5-methylaminomethyl-2-thiouridine)(34)-methyltransferase MnmD [Marinifilaceae bacterium]|jgi:tRNA U34 5-methylaminomethyl-2-thiouridine-forming methyltransferase MnmC|nr:tRNA (5-methylaminomethyl-2-thiouridine)(34)-methyltransferase MnmD [Marinifilaceae bacterium]
MFERKLIITEDGSSSIELIDADETYHSKYGAIDESRHIYINNGLDFIEKDNIKILEFGFGTGLNALLSLNNKGNRKIEYHTIEKYPVELEIVDSLNYVNQINPDLTNQFKFMHESEWAVLHNIDSGFDFVKYNIDIKDIRLEVNYDLVYFDCFNPDLQPDLWTEEIFEKIYDNLNNEAVLMTYSSKGIVKQALRSAGFEVKRLKGPKGKRHILQAKKLI